MLTEDFFKNLTLEQIDTMTAFKDAYGSMYLKSLTSQKRSRVKAVKRIHKIMDENILAFSKKNPTTCRKGCSYCCHVYIYSTIDEAQAIVNYCKHNNLEIDKEILLQQSKYTREVWPDQEHSKCIFLDQKSECSIYPIRPMTCRKFFVASDPELCDTSTGIHRVKILHNIEVELMTAGVYEVRDTNSLPRQLLKIL